MNNQLHIIDHTRSYYCAYIQNGIEKLFGGQFQWMTKSEFANKFDMKHDYDRHQWTNAHLDEGLERCDVALVVIKTSQTPSLGLAVSGVCCPSQALKHVNKICNSNYTLRTLVASLHITKYMVSP